MSLFRTKPIDVNADTGLKRCLGAFDLTMLGIGCIIGTGIFVLTGVVAAQHSGPAIVLSFILSGTACAFAALSYAELAGAIGGAGSAYGYAYSGIGELIAWIIGWDLILEYSIATSTVAIGWSGYFGKIMELLGSASAPRADERPARRRHRQCTRHGHRAAAVGAAVGRRARVRPFQHHHGVRQARGRSHFHHRRGAARQPGQLASLHPAAGHRRQWPVALRPAAAS